MWIGVGLILLKIYFLESLRLPENSHRMFSLGDNHFAYQQLDLLLTKNPFFFSFLYCFEVAEEYLDFIIALVIINESNKLIDFHMQVIYFN